MESLKELLMRHGFTFKKAFGQNFITDNNLLDKIVQEAGVAEKDTVIEIGVGAGTLTRAISKRAKRVIGYEIDTKLKPILEDSLYGINNVEIIYRDVMKSPIEDLEKMVGGEYMVVANLPYYITTPIIMRFVEKAKRIKSMVIMVQEEVARRLVAKEDTADYGSITSAIGVVGDAKIILKVPSTMFTPRPNVDSAVVKIDFNRKKFDVKNMETFREVLRCAFGNRRKMLINNLMQTFKLDRAVAEELLTSQSIDLKARGETLSTKQFVELANKLTEIKR